MSLAGRLEQNLEMIRAEHKRWTLAQAIEFCRELEKHLSCQPIVCHVALTGGVLYRGQSDKDLDVVLYPHDSSTPIALHTLCVYLERCGLQRVHTKSRADATQDQTLFHSRLHAGTDQKEISIWQTPEGKRIDFFFLDFKKPTDSKDPFEA